MKNLLLLLVAINLSLASLSQITKNNWLVGGSANFFSSKSTFSNEAYNPASEEINLGIAPHIGYFPLDKFAVGLSPSFSWGKGKVTTEGGGYSNIKRFLIGPFARYYFLNTEKPFNILVSTAYQYGIYSFKPTKGKIDIFSVSAGTVIFFNWSVGLELMLGYSSRVEDIENTYKTTQKGFQTSIGLQIHLEKE